VDQLSEEFCFSNNCQQTLDSLTNETIKALFNQNFTNQNLTRDQIDELRGIAPELVDILIDEQVD